MIHHLRGRVGIGEGGLGGIDCLNPDLKDFKDGRNGVGIRALPFRLFTLTLALSHQGRGDFGVLRVRWLLVYEPPASLVSFFWA